ncbi:uncharacterized protein Gm16867 isoform X3 [Mus musculus]|nr:uncharacterized protein Gm16867 isoform X3 [Mus musculus]|eukprot:XP_011243595.1 PREDICTED: uncharacterized protein Gm16867 isoform X3 [Mus musculus]
MCSGQRRHTERWVPSARRTNSAATAGLFFSSYWCFWPLGSTPARHGVSRRNPGEEVPTLRSEVFLPLPLLPTSCRLPRPAGPRMELRRGGVGNQAAGRRMDGDCRDGGCGSKDAGSEDYENLPTSASVSTHMTAGAMAGILEHSIMYPVDSVKVPSPLGLLTSLSSWCLLVFDIKNRRLSDPCKFGLELETLKLQYGMHSAMTTGSSGLC